MKSIYIDLFVLFISSTSFIQGWKKGFVHLVFRAVGYIGGGVLGLFLARNYGLHHHLPFNATLFFIVALIVGALVGDVIGAGFATLLHKKILPDFFARLDSVLGGLIGLIRTLIATAIVFTIVLSVSHGIIHRSIATSQSYKLLHNISPRVVATAMKEAKRIK